MGRPTFSAVTVATATPAFLPGKSSSHLAPEQTPREAHLVIKTRARPCTNQLLLHELLDPERGMESFGPDWKENTTRSLAVPGRKSNKGEGKRENRLRTKDAGWAGNLDAPLIQSFNKHLSSSTCMPGIVLGNTAGTRQSAVLVPCGTDIPAGEVGSDQEK